MKKVFVLGAIMLLLLPALAGAQSIVDFDDVSGGTVINNNYAGLTFTCLPGTGENSCTGTNVYAVTSPFATSVPNVVSIYSSIEIAAPAEGEAPPAFAPFDSTAGIIRVDFASCTPPTVSIQAIPDDSNDPAFLEAYNSSDVLVDSFTSVGDSGSGNPVTLTVSGSNIAYVLFSGVEGQTVSFDDLSYACATSVPTTSEWGAMALALLLAGISLVAIRKRAEA